MTFERAESTFLVFACDFCLIKTSGIVPGVTADEGATRLVLLDVGSGYMKAVPAAGKTVTDYLVEGGKRFTEQFFRRRVRSRCDGEPTTLANGARLKEMLPESVVLERTPRHDRQVVDTSRGLVARFLVKTNGATPYQDAHDSTLSSELLPFDGLVLFRSHSITPDTQIRTGQSTEVTVDGIRVSGVVDWTRSTHTSVERLQEESADFF